MIAMRHTGIYVRDIQVLEEFYTFVFHMLPICSMQPDQSGIFDELLGILDVEIMTTKLITPYGKMAGQGDMLELVKVVTNALPLPELSDQYPIFATGMGHIAFGVDNIWDTVKQIRDMRGVQQTKIYEMKNKNLCCFCRDPEGNWLELIQRKVG